MGAIFVFIFKSGLVMMALYLAYRLFLAKAKEPTFNRVVLLLIYIVSPLAILLSEARSLRLSTIVRAVLNGAKPSLSDMATRIEPALRVGQRRMVRLRFIIETAIATDATAIPAIHRYNMATGHNISRRAERTYRHD